MAGWEEHQEIYREVNGLLEFTNEIQKRIKENGLSKETVEGCRETHQEAGLTGSGEAIGQKVMETIEAMAKDLTEGERLLATSDVVESLNGKDSAKAVKLVLESEGGALGSPFRITGSSDPESSPRRWAGFQVPGRKTRFTKAWLTVRGG